MSSQIINNNTFTTTPTSSNPYVSRKLNNMDQAQIMKREREDWLRLYHKTLKGVERMIDVQGLVKDIKKLAEEANTIITEVEVNFISKYQQPGNKCHQYHSNIREPSIYSSKQYGGMNIPNSKDVG